MRLTAFQQDYYNKNPDKEQEGRGKIRDIGRNPDSSDPYYLTFQTVFRIISLPLPPGAVPVSGLLSPAVCPEEQKAPSLTEKALLCFVFRTG